jgi:hypothetical protein
MFKKFYRDNKMRINHLYGEVSGRRYQKHPTMKIEKYTNIIYKTKMKQTEIIEKRRLFGKQPESTRKTCSQN